MENQNQAKTVNMNKDNAPEEKKLTYEQLNDACMQLAYQNKQLLKRNQELESFAINKRLDYLFKAIENKEVFDSSFVYDCANEIKEALTITKDKEDKGE